MVREMMLVAALAASSTAVSAADMPDFDPLDVPDVEVIEAPEVFAGFGGAYIGAGVGYGKAETEVRGLLRPGLFPFDDVPPNEGPKVKPDGGSVSLHAGFNFAFGAFVAGGEVEAGYLGFSDTAFIALPPVLPTRVDDDFTDVSFGAYATASARVGAAFDRVLAYAKVGVAIAQVDARYGDVDGFVNAPVIDPLDLSTYEDNLTGYVFGGGVEYALAPNVLVRAEYNYLDLETVETTNLDGDLFEFENDIQLVKLGLTYKF